MEKIKNLFQEKYLHRLFILGVLFKAFDGTVEILAGMLLLFPGIFRGIANAFIRGELVEDPHDFLANLLAHFLPALAHVEFFATIYLLVHGVVKVFLVVGLLRGKLWAYPAAIIVFALFIIYQIYRYTNTHSFFLILLTILDVFVVWLTWHEWRLFQKRGINI
ncbi:MAG TPA: DUF2127 domain-containing protein [Candidatus Paceibacterota bacterium]|nr:DUF2127 domain-containing protein [Candidatus Paceibacterota bacterium]